MKLILGRSAAPLAEHLGLTTVGQLLAHTPRRYLERGVFTPVSDFVEGDYVTVMGRVESVRQHPHRDRRRSRVEVQISDGGSVPLTLTFFGQAWRSRQFSEGTVGLFAGRAKRFRGRWQLNQPQFEVVDDPDQDVDHLTSRLMPLYPATAKVPTWNIAKAVRTVLDGLRVEDPLGAGLRQRRNLPDLATALRYVHRPEERGEVTDGMRRLKYEEALSLQATLKHRRSQFEGTRAVPRPHTGHISKSLEAGLPFALSPSQQVAGLELNRRLSAEHPMHVLLQGDVGAGKTVVALRAMAQVVDSGGQAVLLAPTEVLAAQHAQVVRRLLGPLAEAGTLLGDERGAEVALLTSSLPEARKREVRASIAAGGADIIIGTHAVLERSVQYHDLGLVVVDEQHRFGVEQRAELVLRDGPRPHLLVMTATPIPRSIAMTVFGDLDVLMLEGRREGPADVETYVVGEWDNNGHIARVWQRAREEVAAGRQVFVVCPRIEEGDREADEESGAALLAGDGARLEPHAVTAVAQQLREGPLSGLELAVLHGRLPPAEKDEIMRRLAAGPADPQGLGVVVSTTVIEVGIDIPTAALMIILDADRFGISQLHQLRGRIGRDGSRAQCMLVTRQPPDSPGRERLGDVASTTDGFKLAQLDLAQRREGDVLGDRQTGRSSKLRWLSVIDDEELIVAAREDVLVDTSEMAASYWNALVISDDDTADFLEKG
ncbi:MAG: ATP-dependent DNA helicase RecG [Actinobacteria bacterium]|nr:ATP-dependent DNA helicase RecG [Actinomycetota bacterium]